MVSVSMQTLLLLFKCANHRNKRPFVSTANEVLVGTLMMIGDVNDIFPIYNNIDQKIRQVKKLPNLPN